eukprot:Skav201485  [mRNA]  locus=scaffold828:231754:241438:- [translate_table: standard]
MDRLGRKNIQIQGFAMMALLYAVLAAFLDDMEDLPATLLFVYGLTYFFSNFGPNSTTFILPSESFPREVRSSLNGFCAACGKFGAVVGSSMFKPLIVAAGTSFVFICCAVCALLGIIVTVCCIEDRRGQDMMGEEESSTLASSRLIAKNLLVEVSRHIWTFPVFTETFCDQLEAELCNFLDSGLPRTAPNTMNRFGIILSELGFCERLLDPLVFDYVNVVANRLLPAFCEKLDSYRAFTVLYDSTANGDKDLALHYDNAEVTLNINIGGTWGGGNVVYYGLATDKDAGKEVEAQLRRGWGVFHAGLELHKATPISNGRRHNLILWCRSSGVRNDFCPMCFSQPNVVPTNRYYHEGFTVPPCEPTVMEASPTDMSSDDLYD